MGQTITVKKAVVAGDKLVICGVYEVSNNLLVVSNILPGMRVCDGYETLRDTVNVDTNTEHALPVKHYFIDPYASDRDKKYNIVRSLAEIPEIAGLYTLPFERINEDKPVFTAQQFKLAMEKQRLSIFGERFQAADNDAGNDEAMKPTAPGKP